MRNRFLMEIAANKLFWLDNFQFACRQFVKLSLGPELRGSVGLHSTRFESSIASFDPEKKNGNRKLENTQKCPRRSIDGGAEKVKQSLLK